MLSETTQLNSFYLCFRLPYFDVEPHTGKIYVKNKTLVDREVRSLFSATLQARDTDEKPGTTVLEIILTDINDQPPVISRDSYREFVNEGGQLELKIEVTVREQYDNSKYFRLIFVDAVLERIFDFCISK